MGKKSRIIPVEEPPKVSRIPLNPTLVPKAEFGSPLNLRKLPKFRGPLFKNYTGVASWEVINTDDQILEFLEVSDKIGNVRKLFHGTPARNITSIAATGLRPGSGGMFGAGIYLGEPAKAMNYTRGLGAHYLLQVEVALGEVKACEQAESHSRRRLKTEGFNSVKGVAGVTKSWGGTLHYDEFVIYSPEQVLVLMVHEYQQTYTDLVQETQGSCGMLVEKNVSLSAKSRSFKDVLSRQPCGKTSYTRVQVKTRLSRSTSKGLVHWGYVWLCKDCIERDKIHSGSWISIKSNSSHHRESEISVQVQ